MARYSTANTQGAYRGEPLYRGGRQRATCGSGVMVSSIDRARNDFFDQQWRGQNATLGNAQVQQGALQQLQAIYNEPSDTALNALFSNFWNGWRDLANAPDSSAQRTSLIQTSVTLTQALNQTRGQLVAQLDP